MTEIFEADIKSILSHINEQENEFVYSFIKKLKFEGDIYYISFDIFEDLVKHYCFSIWGSKPMERIIPEERLSLFREVFLENMDFSITRTILWYGNMGSYSEEILYLLLFYHLFKQSICTENSINKIFEQALSEWKSAFTTNKMPIKLFLFLLDTVFVESDRMSYQIAEDLELVRLSSYKSITGSSLSQVSHNWQIFDSILLKLNAFQLFDHNFYGGFSEENHSMDMNKGEFQEILNRIRYYMMSFYLKGYNMMREEVEIFTPWWIRENLKKFKTSKIHFENKNLKLDDLNQLKTLFEKIVKLDLFKDKELDLVLYYYNELHNRTLIFELILYDFIILESLFTRGSTSELTFRLSLNLALFISESKEEFKTIFQFSKKLYSIRSAIIHGEIWSKKLLKNKIPEQLGLDSNEKEEVLARAIHERLLMYINKAIKKVIQLKLEQVKNSKSPEIIKNFKDLYFLLDAKIVSFKNE